VHFFSGMCDFCRNGVIICGVYVQVMKCLYGEPVVTAVGHGMLSQTVVTAFLVTI